MCEAVRHVQVMVALVVKLVTLPAPERRRARPDVDEHVEDRPARAAHQLRHARLEVHAAQHPARRARVVVLDPLVVHAELGERRRPERLEEEAARVPVDGGLEEKRAFEAGFEAVHGVSASTRSQIKARERERRRGRRRRRVANVEGARRLRDDEVVDEATVTRDGLGADAVKAAVKILGPDLWHVLGGRRGEGLLTQRVPELGAARAPPAPRHAQRPRPDDVAGVTRPQERTGPERDVPVDMPAQMHAEER